MTLYVWLEIQPDTHMPAYAMPCAGVMFNMVPNPNFWWYSILATTTCVVPLVAYRVCTAILHITACTRRQVL